ncbi:MAG: energy-coupling factor transporter ATPase [Clostridia bacterium]|nr:energy-coupling factor transporter ATPase [Clostridia bacterium]
MIEIRNLTFAYDNETEPALTDINLDIRDGEWLALIGGNGSGKSTLLRQLNGLLLPSRGRVLVDGLDTADSEQLWQARQKVALVFQNPDNQFIAASVEDDVAFGLENLGLPPMTISNRVEGALGLMQLIDKRTCPPHQLSGGEKQRVALAGAIAMASTYLALDEPTSMLDPQLRGAVLETLQYLQRKLGLAIVYATNILQEALWADRVIVLEQGRVVRQGTPAEIFADPQWLAEKGLALPPICRLAALVAAAGYEQFQGVVTEAELEEKLLCGK